MTTSTTTKLLTTRQPLIYPITTEKETSNKTPSNIVSDHEERETQVERERRGNRESVCYYVI